MTTGRKSTARKKGPAGRRARLAACAAAFAFLPSFAVADAADDYRLRPPEDEVIYFVLPDRFENADPANDAGGIAGGRLDHGFDPTHKGFFHGGDLRGLTARLDYIQGLGATAIWLGPIYKNKPVQGPPGEESAGYHGYWITDFATVDPHFGTEDDLKAFVDAAHARGMKVYLDIIANHTADVIAYRECHDPDYDGSDRVEGGCPYRAKGDYPYTTRGGQAGAPINDGFMGDAPPFRTEENFARLKRPDYAYTPYVPAGEENVKKPAWLNDLIYYHNRGDSLFVGESSLYGDFSGLDDLMTEHPRVVEGMIEIYKSWISKYKIDGFRVDTARHVEPAFWRAFVPAMIEHAAAEGVPNFYVFGEAYDPEAGGLARFTRVDGFPAVLDFAFQRAVTQVVAQGEPAERLERLFFLDALYEDGGETARRLPVFVGNHDMGRFAMFARQARPDAPDEEIFKRVRLAHAMMFFLRGIPVVYYGDEQGFVGDGGDQAAREDMFESQVASYNDNDLVGTDATTAQSNFDRRHPLYRAIADMARLYHAHEPLRRGTQRVRRADTHGGLFAVSRLGRAGGEYLVVFNADTQKRTAWIETDPRSTSWKSVYGRCARKPGAPASLRVEVPALDYVICRSNEWSPAE
ncbi:MAG: alpha-amylase family glycosyl hydrolase [Amphiplicatus sp.]